MQAFGHLDADCFYVSAERVRHRFLLGKPVGVISNQGACIIAKSYEMKATGIKTGTPIWDAVKICPEGIYVKRDFRWYEALSQKMLETVKEFSPAVEFYSIDEVFFRATPYRGLSLQKTAEAMRDHLLKTIGVPVTVGIGRTKTLAKLISDTAKPFGAKAVLEKDEVNELLGRLAVTEISGIAKRRAEKLAPYGIATCLDFAQANRKLVNRLITVTGEALWWELNGDPVSPLHVERPPHKMLSRGGSLGGATTDARKVYGWLVRNVERLIEELDFHRVVPGMLSVYLLYRNGLERLARTPTTSARFDLLMDAARWCLERIWVPGLAAYRMHVTASLLQRPGFVQRSLFDREEDTAVADVKKQINAKIGRFAVRSAATLPLTEIYRDAAQGYDICDIRGKICF